MDLEDRLSVLLKEKQRLSSELAECKADKEFVWLLWKQLQSTSPDVASAVGMVVTREKEKTERKDKKVLEILQRKDARISQLETSLLDKAEGLRHHEEELQAMRAAHQDKLVQFESEISSYRMQLEETKETVRKLREDLAEQKKEHANDLQGSQQEGEALKAHNLELVSQLTESKKECQTLSTLLAEERNSNSREVETAKQLRSALQAKCHQLEEESRGLKRECQTSSHKINELNEIMRRLQLEEECKNGQVSELQACVRDAEQISKECRIALEVEKKLHQESLHQLNETTKQAQVAYNELQQILLEAQQRHVAELAEKSRENEELKLRMGGTVVNRETQTAGFELQDSSTSPLRLSHLSTTRPSVSTKSHASKSTNDTTAALHLERQMTDIQLELEATKETLVMKMQELKEVKSAHANRLRRLQDLQMNYKLVLEQLKTYEEESIESSECLNLESKPSLRASAKQLQQEDSDTVWNELNHYKAQNKSLQTERVALEEECDVLRVRVAEQLSAIHDLRECLETEKDSLIATLELSSPKTAVVDLSSHHDTDYHQLIDKETAEVLQASILHLEEDKQKLITARRQQQEECFQLREQVARLKARLLHSQLDACHVAVQCSVVESDKSTMTDLRGLEKAIVALRHTLTQTDENTQTDVLVTASNQHMDTLASSHAVRDKHVQTVGTVTLIQHDDKEVQTDGDASQQQSFVLGQRERQLDFRSKSAGTVFAFGSHFVAPRQAKSKGKMKSLKTEEQVRLLQQRVASLTRQLSVVCKAKENTVSELEEQHQNYQQLAREHQSCSHHIYTMQVLQTELDAQRAEKAQLQQRLSEALLVRTEQMAMSNVSDSSVSRHSEAEWKQLEHKAKSTSEECVRQGRFIKSLKSELHTQEEQTRGLQEKCSRLERDIGRKQSLVEDMRSRLKIARDEAESLSTRLKSTEAKLENAEETHEQRRTRLQALKDRLAHETDEQGKLQLLYHSVQAELDKKSCECQQLKGRLRRSETALAQVAEKARQSEALKEQTHGKALALVERRLEHTGKQLDEYRIFVKAFAQELIQQVREAWQLSRALGEKPVKQPALETPTEETSRSWARAKEVSCSILNISEAEFAEFMHPSEAPGVPCLSDHPSGHLEPLDQLLGKKESTWWKKSVKLANSQPPFAVALMELFLAIIDERLQLLTC